MRIHCIDIDMHVVFNTSEHNMLWKAVGRLNFQSATEAVRLILVYDDTCIQ